MLSLAGLAVVEPQGESTRKRIIVCSVLLIPISILPRLLGMSGSIYAIAAVAAGLGLLYFGVRFGQEHTSARARHVLLGSIVYLPAVLAVMVLDRRLF